MSGSSPAAGMAAPARPSTVATPASASVSAPRVSQQRVPRVQPSTTASRLRVLGAASVLICTLNGAAGYLTLDSDVASTAAAASEQGERLASLDTSVDKLRSETDAILAGGKAATDTSSSYDAALSSLTREVSYASSNGEANAEEYASIHAALTRYATTIERARVAAAAGKPTTELARDAETLLAQDVQAPLGQLRQSTTELAERSQAGSAALTGFLGLTTLLSLLTLIGGSGWLALKTHRIINPPLVGAILLSAGVSSVAAASIPAAATIAPYVVALRGLAHLPAVGPLLLLGGLGAGALAWGGISQRLREYR
ncbi:hypothetical protein [Gephyromycinifex aptenodytis]|uniref:hypothetical protein n=1 Tax=Gephyromycinifex aptenodytis TaxID=2716227 RepID=UPI001445AE81|nr:hypothetical protein [Gephyromycinifex aptenodytis]